LKAHDKKAKMVIYDANSMYQLGCHIGYLWLSIANVVQYHITSHERIFMYGYMNMGYISSLCHLK
jgi:hypothetical protein